MIRLLYSTAVWLAAPLVLAATAMRGPEYRDRLGERLGYTRLRFAKRPLWVHAASVGEVQAAAPLVRQLLKRYPQAPVLVTTFSPTGADRVRALFADAVRHAYLPYDAPGAVRRFLEAVDPQLAIVMEREIWPTLFAACARRRIPVLLASARISAPSAQRHRPLGALFGPALSRNVTIAAQTEADAQRYRTLGAAPGSVHMCGNLKFDIEPPHEAIAAGEELRSMLGARPVWIAGSTHEGEEALVLDAHERVRAKHPDALLILVPRHPQRFADVAALLERRRVRYVSRSSQQPAAADTAVVFADTLGELMALYAAADVAFVGGSLVPIGGHNLLEPAVLAKPIIVGPHNFNAADIAAIVIAQGAGVEVSSSTGLAGAVLELFANPEQRVRAGAAGRAIIEANRGAVQKTLQLVEQLVPIAPA